MRTTVAALGLAALLGCVSDDPELEHDVDYVLPTGVAIGDDILVALTRVELGNHRVELTRVRGGEAGPLSPALVDADETVTVGSPQIAAIDGTAYLTYYSQGGYHGAPLTEDDAIDTSAIVDLGFNPTLTRVGDRFAAVSFPQQPFIVVFPPVDSFRVTLVRRDGAQDDELAVATQASPVDTIGLPPRCAGNAKALALPFRRPTFSGSYTFIARVSDTGAVLDPDGIQIAPDANDHTVGVAQVAVTDDGGVLVIYARTDQGVTSMHATRIEPGANPAVSDQAIDLARPPAFLVASGAQILAVSVPADRGSQLPQTFEIFETRILDSRGRTVSGPFTISTGARHATVLATSTGFAALHSESGRDPQLTPIGRDGKPGETIALATAHRAP